MLEIALDWKSPLATHRERRLVQIGPAEVARMGRAGETAAADSNGWRTVNGGLAVPPAVDEALRLVVARRRFEGADIAGLPTRPRVGRFYPRAFLRGMASSPELGRQPMRCLMEDADSVRLDLNHPMAGRDIWLRARTIAELSPALGGPRPLPLAASLDGGPGMQARLPDTATDFCADDPFARRDSRPDGLFYERPRLVHHIDDLARAHIAQVYSRYLNADMAVLDLMASWDSHLPNTCDGARITGLGLNAEELKANPRLAEHAVHDLNEDPLLPFDDAAFDAVLCAVSLEYLVRPIEVFRDVRRVLRPGGPFILTLSERWFPPKAIRLWAELHPFERMGLALDYFERAGGYVELETESIRGWPRPSGDRYADRLAFSDPIYAVSGRRDPGRF